MTLPTALHHTQDAVCSETTNGFAGWNGSQTRTRGEPCDGKVEAALALQMAMAKQVKIDSAIGGGKSELRNQEVGELLPHEFRVGFLRFHFSSS